jgi:hypothetical protein
MLLHWRTLVIAECVIGRTQTGFPPVPYNPGSLAERSTPTPTSNGFLHDKRFVAGKEGKGAGSPAPCGSE